MLLSIMAIYTSILILFFILLSIMVIYTSTLIFFLLLFCYRSWRFTPAPWFYFCCYFVIDDDYLHQHLDFLFVYILLSIMTIYTSTLIFFCFVIDHGYLRQCLDFVFVVILLSIMVIYTSTLIFCCYFVIDRGYLHQHLDFLFVILLSIMGIYTSTLISLLLLFSYRSWLFTPAPWLCFYFVTDHGYLHQHLDFPFVVIFLSIMVIYTSILIFFLLLLCYRSWRFTPAP